MLHRRVVRHTGAFICFTIVSTLSGSEGFYLIRRGGPPSPDRLPRGIEGGDAAVIVAIALIVAPAVIGIWSRLGDLLWLFIWPGGR